MVELTRRARLRSARGAELIELAMVLPLLLLLIGGIVDFAFMFQAFEVLNNAAREGARVAVLPGYDPFRDPRHRVDEYVRAAGLPNQAITSIRRVALAAGGGSPITSSFGYEITVTYPHQFTILGPLMSLARAGSIGDNVTLTARSTMRAEM